MPGGHASHKGTSAKPNTNAEGQLDIAAGKGVNPQDALSEDTLVDSDRIEEAVDYPPATERPSPDQQTERESGDLQHG
jgi:hypothetical protein